MASINRENATFMGVNLPKTHLESNKYRLHTTFSRVFVFLLVIACFFSCTEKKEDPRTEIISVVKRNTGLDISGIPSIVSLDSTGQLYHAFELKPSELHIWRLQFEPRDYETLKSSIRATPYFNAFTIFENWGSEELWAEQAPNADQGLWIIANSSYHFILRTTPTKIKVEGEWATFDLDTANRTMDISFADY